MMMETANNFNLSIHKNMLHRFDVQATKHAHSSRARIIGWSKAQNQPPLHAFYSCKQMQTYKWPGSRALKSFCLRPAASHGLPASQNLFHDTASLLDGRSKTQQRIC